MQALALWERELRSLPPGTTPSYNFLHSWIKHFGDMGFARDRVEYALVQVGDWVRFEAAFESFLRTEG